VDGLETQAFQAGKNVIGCGTTETGSTVNPVASSTRSALILAELEKRESAKGQGGITILSEFSILGV
jgi:hypothetical protein